MIESKELRVGNWVSCCSTYIKVECITYTGINYSYLDEEDEYLFSDLKPIHLTGEILEKCGFEKYDWQNAYFKKTLLGDLYIHFFKEQIITHFALVSRDSKGHKMKSLPFIGKIKKTHCISYLHHLQNLFHAICGVDLEVNL